MSTTLISYPQIIPNEKQQECINTLNGPIIVLAGPGTGKTTTIIKRIENMLAQNIPPESILALTFSESAANEMKVRLLNQVGTKASSVVIHTYHAFCSDIISQNSLRFELLEDYNVIDNLNKHRLMKEVIDEYRPKHLVTKRSDPYFYIPYLLNAVHEIKLNRVKKDAYLSVIENNKNWKPELQRLQADKKTQEELEKAGKRNHLKTTLNEIETLEAHIKKTEDIWNILEKYNYKLNQNTFIDFDDMINFVLDAFEEDSRFLEDIRSNYKYFLVDEYQDTNHSQNELIFKLASDSPEANIFVVGDDDQIIYSFQGAQVDNLERFLKYYPDAKVICLNENNRSTQTILDFSNKIISQDDKRLENNPEFTHYHISKKLIAKNESVIKLDNKVQLHTFADKVQENNFILDQIQSIINENPELPLSEIAILVRTNAELEFFADQLKAKNIPFQISKQRDIFTLKPSLLVYLYLKALENHNVNSMGLFGLIAHSPFDFAVEDYAFLTQENLRTNADFITLIKEHLNKHTWQDREKVVKFVEIFNELKSLINDEKLSNLVICLINKTGILEYYASKEINRFENIAALKKFVDEVKTFEKITRPSTLTMLLSYLDSSIKENIVLEIDDDSFIENAVQLITLHKSKGREFSYVFMVNLNAKAWEKRRSMEVLKLPIDKVDFSKNSEVARLLFVGCSRAKHHLVLTHSNIVNGKNEEISQFILKASEHTDCVEQFNHEINSNQYLEEVIQQFSYSPLYQKQAFLEDLKQRAIRHVMSPSSLYSYNTCPKAFLYSYIYRIPVLDPINASMSFGSAIHKALEKFIKIAIKSKKYPEKEKLLTDFSKAIGRELFPSIQEREIRLNHGIKVLNEYYQNLTATPPQNIIDVEVNINLLPVDKYFVKGKIDRVEVNNNNEYVLIDYKTGSPKYKNQVMNEDGTHKYYLDQLRFYKLLYEIKNPAKKVPLGIILFVEDPDKSLYIELTDKDMQIIKETILSTFEKIHELKFTGVDEKKQQAESCKNCLYKLLCALNTL